MIEPNMNSSYEVLRVERDMQAARSNLALAEAVNRLRSNRDFKTVIIEGYLQQEAIRLVMAKANPEFQSADSQAIIINDINGIGSFNTYLNTITSHGDVAAKQLPEQEDLHAELLREAAGE